MRHTVGNLGAPDILCLVDTSHLRARPCADVLPRESIYFFGIFKVTPVSAVLEVDVDFTLSRLRGVLIIAPAALRVINLARAGNRKGLRTQRTAAEGDVLHILGNLNAENVVGTKHLRHACAVSEHIGIDGFPIAVVLVIDILFAVLGSAVRINFPPVVIKWFRRIDSERCGLCGGLGIRVVILQTIHIRFKLDVLGNGHPCSGLRRSGIGGAFELDDEFVGSGLVVVRNAVVRVVAPLLLHRMGLAFEGVGDARAAVEALVIIRMRSYRFRLARGVREAFRKLASVLGALNELVGLNGIILRSAVALHGSVSVASGGQIGDVHSGIGIVIIARNCDYSRR